MALAFPNCFVQKGLTKRPIKIGIKKDLLQQARAIYPGMSARRINVFLADYTSGYNYQACIRKGAVRVDLDGNFSGFVSQGEQDFAIRRIADIQAGRKSRDRKPGPAKQSIGSAFSAVVETLEQKLQRLEMHQFSASQSDNFYFTSGRKSEDDVEIEAVKAAIRARDAAPAGASA